MAQWEITGEFFDSCNCESICPCVTLSPPTHGDCKGLVAWSIAEGRSGELDLAGRRVVLALHAPGPLAEGNMRVALYIDDGASPAQMDELTEIFSGQKGGHFEILSSLIGEVVGVKQVPIEIVIDGKSRTLRMPGIADTKITAIEGHEGADLTVTETPLAFVPGGAQTVGRANGLTYNDFDFDWTHPDGGASLMAPFTYQG
jgi:hypothetical protein